MRKTRFISLFLLLTCAVYYAGAQVVISPGAEYTLTQNSADGGSAGDNGNGSFTLNSAYSTSAKTIKAQATGGISVGTGEAHSQIYYDFEVGDSAGTTNDTVGAWISYSVDRRGYQVISPSVSTNASVNVEIVLRDLTEGRNLHVETVHKLDLKTYSFADISVGFDFTDSGTKVDVFSAVLKRGHSYRLTLRLSSTLFIIVSSALLSTCDYMDGFAGGGDGRVELNSLYVKVGLDEKEVLRILDGIQNHRHIYLTGRGVGHNNTEAQSSLPILGSTPAGPPTGDVSSPPIIPGSDPATKPGPAEKPNTE